MSANGIVQKYKLLILRGRDAIKCQKIEPHILIWRRFESLHKHAKLINIRLANIFQFSDYLLQALSEELSKISKNIPSEFVSTMIPSLDQAVC